jgi:hypothetical protein
MWIGIWIGKRRGEPEYEALLRRYWEFRPGDIVLVCEWHHAEIHKIYDRVISEFRHKIGKPLRLASWEEAEELMQLLEQVCEAWIEQESPGYDPARLRADRVDARIVRAGPQPKTKLARKRRRKRKAKVRDAKRRNRGPR